MRKQKRNIVGCCIGLLAMILLSVAPVTEASSAVIASYTGPVNQYYSIGVKNGAYIQQSIGESFTINPFPVGNSCILKQISFKLCKVYSTWGSYVKLQVWYTDNNGIPINSPAPIYQVYVPASKIQQLNPLPLPVFTVTLPFSTQLSPGHYAVTLETRNIKIVTEGKNNGNPYSNGAIVTRIGCQSWISYPNADLYFSVTAEVI